MTHDQTTGWREQYRGPAADAKATEIRATLGTDMEQIADTIWLLRYMTVKHGIRALTHEELLEERYAE